MKQEIKPTYVSFEQAKWLKSKNAKLETHYCFKNNSSMWYFIHSKSKENKLQLYTYKWFNSFDNMLYAPEQWQVVEWILKNYNLYIWVVPYADRKTFQPYWVYMNERSKDTPLEYHLSGNASISGSDYKTPQEAYSAVFDYIKDNNLI